MTRADQPAARLDALDSRALADGHRIAEASTRKARLKGLAKMEPMAPEIGLHLPKCRSIHTFSMRFALDLLWLDQHGHVVRIDRDVGPRRARTCLRARSVVEVRAGEADAFVAAGVGEPPAP